MKILISGYYGFGNTGDEAILQSIVEGVRERAPGAEITVLSSSPKLTAEFYKVNSIYRYSWPAIFRSLRRTDVFVSGGGTLFQNATSCRSFFYYLGLVMLAKLLLRKVMIFAQGFGPLQGWLCRALARFVLNRVDVISLRDQDAYDQMRQLGIRSPKMAVTADPTLILKIPAIDEGEKLLSLEGIKKKGRPLLGISIRSFKKGDEDEFYEGMIKAVDWLCQAHHFIPVFILFQCPQDMHNSSKIIHRVKEKTHLIFRICRPNEMLSLFSQFDLFIGLRLHALIFSLMNNVPMLGISYDPKVESFMKTVEQPYVALDKLNRMPEILNNIILNKENIKKRIEKKKTLLREKAKQNFDLLWKL
jgi:polysaccharide pyruvyl transferase CsaB